MTDPRRRLPSVERLLRDPGVTALLRETPRAVVVAAARSAVADARAAGAAEPSGGWARAIAERVRLALQPSLRAVINASGVVLHTNLGRAPLARTAIDATLAASVGYSTLEYDLESGTRGSRQTHCRRLLLELTGAEDALVVNNAASALLLALTALADDGETIVSRGELIEIGGAFRLPEVIAASGTRLVEVGTTNRTHSRDYERAVTPATRMLLKVHRSNFEIRGFTAEVEADDVARLAAAAGVRSLYDVGSGLLADLRPWRLSGEPRLPEAIASGVDLVVCSGDKLLGGPQAGVILGRAAVLGLLRAHPVARAVRPDKLTLAALEATLALYRDAERARVEIPVLRMLTATEEELREAASELADALPDDAGAELREGVGEVGGGAFPGTRLPTTLVALRPAGVSVTDLAARLRAHPPHVVARVEDERVVLDPRTLLPGQGPLVVRAVAAALRALRYLRDS